MLKRWTEEQQEAISRDGTILLSAAAGSGKTAVLVERIIQRILREDNPIAIDRLLVVTFTEAAAGEMRQRLYAALGAAAEKDPENRHIQKQLTLLPRATICTIDAFCSRLLKNNFHRAGISPQFGVGDRAQLALLEEEAVEAAIASCEAEHLEMFEGIEGRQQNTLPQAVKSLYLFASSLPFPERWLAQQIELQDNELFFERYGEPLIRNLWEEAMEIKERYAVCIAYCAEPDGPAARSDQMIAEEAFFAELAAFAKKKDWDRIFLHCRQNPFEKLKPKTKDTNPAYDFYQKQTRKMAKDLLADSAAVFYDTLEGVKKDHAVTAKVISDLCKLTIRYSQELWARKTAENLLDFSDLEHETVRLLSEDPALAQELREQYDEVYVDEYQDTNGVQAYILERIARRDNLFMVGDPKQGIYGFRNADPSLFLQKAADFTADSEKGQVLYLSRNFRSTKNTLAFANHLFERLFSPELGGILYGDKERLHWGEHIKDGQKPAAEVHLLEQKGNTADALVEEAHFTAKRILEIVEIEKRQIFDRDIGDFRPVTYRDIAILSRVQKGVAEVFAEVLSSYNIPIYTEVKGGFLAAHEITMLLAFLQVIDNPMQDLPVLQLLRSPIYSFSDEDLARLRAAHPYGCFYEALAASKEEKAVSVTEQWRRFRTLSQEVTVEDTLRTILDETGFPSAVGLMPGGTARLANLDFLLDQAARFEQDGFKGVPAFVRYIRSYLENGTDWDSPCMLSENDDVVRMMTIHKSKGLEYPIVFLVDLGRQRSHRDLSAPLLYDRTLGPAVDCVDIRRRLKYPSVAKMAVKLKKKKELIAEELRLLYVALTRPISHVILVGSSKKLQENFIEWEATDPSPQTSLRSGNLLDILMPALHDREKLSLDFKLHNAAIATDSDDDTAAPFTLPKALAPSEEIAESLSYRYPHERATQIPAKASVTDLAGGMHPNRLSKPRFAISEKDAAFAGTVIHFILQNMDLTKADSAEGLQSEIDRMTESGMLTKEQAAIADVPRLLAFYTSPQGTRLRNALSVKREVHFFLRIPASELEQELPADCKEETVLVQGAVDCCFEEEDGFVILDYKTGRADDPAYQKQLALYKRGLQPSLPKPVKEMFLCKI